MRLRVRAECFLLRRTLATSTAWWWSVSSTSSSVCMYLLSSLDSLEARSFTIISIPISTISAFFFEMLPSSAAQNLSCAICFFIPAEVHLRDSRAPRISSPTLGPLRLPQKPSSRRARHCWYNSPSSAPRSRAETMASRMFIGPVYFVRGRRRTTNERTTNEPEGGSLGVPDAGSQKVALRLLLEGAVGGCRAEPRALIHRKDAVHDAEPAAHKRALDREAHRLALQLCHRRAQVIQHLRAGAAPPRMATVGTHTATASRGSHKD
mmetsp:Transcript_37247/g.95204  ORF Transcript_37247/g.95204 Transcript_37247/m.95204 type:complete len:265 (-) Transcript_37247:161-955(-)